MQKSEVALMFSDIRGYSRLLELDEQDAIGLLALHDKISQEVITEYNGRLVKRNDDSVLASFVSANDAYLCALDFLERLKSFNENKDKPRRLIVSIGLHKGIVETRNDAIFGEQVNIVARLQALAEPGSVCMSDTIYGAISRMIDIKAIEYRDVELENLPGSHNVYKTLSIYREEFKTARPVLHEKSDFRYRIREIEHIRGNGGSFFITAFSSFAIISLFILLAGWFHSRQSGIEYAGLVKLWFNSPALYAALIPASVFLSALYARRKMRAVFDDIRDVDRILSYIMSQLGYKHPVHSKGYMLFKPQGANFFILGMRKFRARVDGNTIVLQGPYLYMSKLIKMLKYYEQTGKTDKF
ncbi:MAG: adenylate/guanylate cyclase domain-containing protein [Bacteroidales bacterium]|nr:adenylate/guanylate cyclase domain-containing protein [Bacteroidales bacterium]MBK9357999.1 adenylate/guanylate cyclase domain-containing protein [Bacteroidales bacterium]